jgi:hypothetical protein
MDKYVLESGACGEKEDQGKDQLEAEPADKWIKNTLPSRR